MERVAIPLLFFPIGLLKLFSRLGCSDALCIVATVILTAACLLGFFIALFTARALVRWISFAVAGLILVGSLIGWHWRPDASPLVPDSRSEGILGPPSDD